MRRGNLCPVKSLFVKRCVMQRSASARILFCVATAFLFAMPGVRADVRLPSVIGSHMVLQRDKPLPIWGKADPGEEVTVQLGDRTEKAKADDKGRWKVT